MIIFSTFTSPPRPSALAIKDKKIMSPTSSNEFTPHIFYKSFEELGARIKTLKLSDWKIEFQNDFIKVYKQDGEHLLPKHEIYIVKNLEFTFLPKVFWLVSSART